MRVITECRSCGSARLTRVLSLGEAPLANALTDKRAVVKVGQYPLDLLLCGACSLTQLSVTVPPNDLFEQYLYFSSVSSGADEHATQLAKSLIASRGLGTCSLVVEIGSNDGYLLWHFAMAGIPVLGIEPAKNVAAVAEYEGVRTISEFFSRTLAQKLARERKADLILANNVMAHMPDINDAVAGIAELLSPTGVFVMDTPYVKCMLDGLQYDTIYHEHVFYYSLMALTTLLGRHGLHVTSAEVVPIHGGSLRMTAAHAPAATAASLLEQPLLMQEARWRAGERDAYDLFAQGVEYLRETLRMLLLELRAAGRKIAAYGAAAKGAMLLHSLGDAVGAVEYVVDKSPHKQGLYMPEGHLRIYPPSRLLETQPDYTLMLPWNLEREIVSEQAEYLRRGGKFIVPVPYPRLVRGA